MKRLFVYLAIAILTLGLGLYAHLATSDTPGYFWRNLSGAQITSNGQIIPDAHIYQYPDGMLLMNLGEDHGWDIYWPQVHNIGSCNTITYIPIPGYIYAKDCDSKFCPCALMGRAKTEINANLYVQPHSLEFTSVRNERIRVSW
jgi:hypothetical protein